MRKNKKLQRKPTHPGEFVENFLEDLDLHSWDLEYLRTEIGLPIEIIGDLINQQVGSHINNKIAEKLSAYFNTSKEFWLNAQAGYDKGIKEYYDYLLEGYE